MRTGVETVRKPRTRLVVAAVACMLVGGLALPATAGGCPDNGAEMAAIAQFGQGDNTTAGEVWGTMASTQHSDSSDAADGPGVVARHMELQMGALCGSEG